MGTVRPVEDKEDNCWRHDKECRRTNTEALAARETWRHTHTVPDTGEALDARARGG